VVEEEVVEVEVGVEEDWVFLVKVAAGEVDKVEQD
jgi:hypothetical protein